MDRLVLSEIVGLFLGAVLLFTGLFFAAGEMVRFARFLQSGLGLAILGQFLLYTLPNVLAFTFPMAMLLATLLGFGRLSGDSEVVALTAAGARFERIMLPVAAFATLVAVMGFYLNNNFAPYASRQRNVLIDRYEKEGTGSYLLAEELFPLKLPNGPGKYFVIHANGIQNLGRGELSGVSVADWQNGKVVAFVYAPRALWQRGTVNWTLVDAKFVTFLPDGSVSFGSLGGTQVREYSQALDSPTNLEFLRSRVEDTATDQLRRRAQVLRQSKNFSEARKAEVEAARRQSLPWASLVFALVGAPLGVRPQRGGKGVGFGVSVIVTFCYWIAQQAASQIGEAGALPADLVLWLPNFACLALGVFLIRRVLR